MDTETRTVPVITGPSEKKINGIATGSAYHERLLEDVRAQGRPVWSDGCLGRYTRNRRQAFNSCLI